jgi:hypothetical protein
VVEVRAIDRNSKAEYTMPLAVGDKVRLFDRVWGIGSNGHVVEVLAASDLGMRVRTASGKEGDIKWSQLQRERGEPVGLAYGYAQTIHTAQSQTVERAIVGLPDGSRSVNAFAAYTALSRHEQRVTLVVNEAAERRQVFGRQMLGSQEAVTEADVIRNLANNLSRQPEKTSATALLARAAEVYRGTVRHMAAAHERRERPRYHNAGWTRNWDRQRAERSTTIRHMASTIERQPTNDRHISH